MASPFPLKHFQQVVLEQLLEFSTTKSHKTAVNGSSPGTGKTAVAIKAMEELPIERALVVCPPAVIPVWPAEIQKFSAHFPPQSISLIQSSKHLPPPPEKVLVTSYGLLHNKKVRKVIGDFKPELMVVDECHKVKNEDAITSGYVMALHELVKYNLWQSGTIVTNSLADLYPLCSLTLPDKFPGGLEQFQKKYCEREEVWGRDRFGKKCLITRYFGGKNIEALRKVIRSEFFTKVPDVIAEEELPEAKWMEVEIDCGKIDTSKSPEEIEKLIAKIEEKGLEFPLDLEAHFAEVRQRTAEAKVSQSEDIIFPYIYAHGPIVLFAYHRRTIDLLMKTYWPFSPLRLDGSVGDKQAVVDEFRKGDSQVLIAQMDVVVGLNGIQDAASQCCFVETNYSPTAIDQAIKRVQRMGQENNQVRVIFLLAKGSVDGRVATLVDKKRKIIKKINE